FGALAVRNRFILEEQVQEALHIQQKFYQANQSAPRLGEILAQRGFMTREQVTAVLHEQFASSGTRFGEIAVTLQFCSQSDVNAAILVQNEIRSFGQNHQR